MDDYLTIEQVAAMLGRSVSATWRIIRRTSLKRYRRATDNRSYFLRSEVNTALATFRPKEQASA